MNEQFGRPHSDGKSIKKVYKSNETVLEHVTVTVLTICHTFKGLSHLQRFLTLLVSQVKGYFGSHVTFSKVYHVTLYDTF